MRYRYEEDAFCREFTSTVVSCEETEDGYEVVLTDTAFYPEGGGQPWDLGTLHDVAVLQVKKKEGKVIHLVETAIPMGTEVVGKIDWSRRFDLMQQHSGEHIVSGLAHALYGCQNVGFHMGKECITIDFDVELTWEQVLELEERANSYIWEDHAVEISYPDQAGLESMDYRSKLELSGDVRIVTFPQGGDCCACCGTHVARSGQVGLVKLLSLQKFREGVRIELLCGGRALAYLSQNRQENLAVSKLLSSKPLDTSKAVERLLAEKEKLEGRLVALEKKRVAALVLEHTGGENQSLFFQDLSMDGLRVLTTELAKVSKGITSCFLEEGDGFRYALGTADGDVRPLVKELNEAFSGRGGGKANLAQGSLMGTKSDIEAFLTEKSLSFS